ncbi:GntR family transcriptional regulator [Romboutsia sp. 13368]|uniref:GntR family transcriptional regulator n=1 Tax=Romboutsia sp. 13368 TaxID=2708053 RepID=UPI0025EFAA7F|nr:GntR family transcriptional regulator [Romboutsia sp. 13368]
MEIVDKNLDIPLHIQLYKIIKGMIESGELSEGANLMPERELCKLQNISRMTVNKAIINLVNEGLLERKQGRGTFVAYKKQKYRFQKLKGFTEVMSDKGFSIRNKILEFEVSTQDKHIREKLEIKNKDELIYKIKRLRIIDNDPFALETVYIPAKMCKGLEQKLKENESLYRIFREEYNYKIDKAIQTIEPISLNEDSLDILDKDINSLALKFDRKVYIKEGNVLEYTISIFTSDKYQYQIMMTE